jgi:hypothetical protein
MGPHCTVYCLRIDVALGSVDWTEADDAGPQLFLMDASGATVDWDYWLGRHLLVHGTLLSEINLAYFLSLI